MVPDDDQAMVLPCASVMVIMVLLNEAATCATPDAMFLRSRRRTRAVASLPIPQILSRPAAKKSAGEFLLLRLDLLLAGDGFGWTLAGARIGVRALTTNRQALAMPQAAIAAQVHQPLDVHRHFAPQVAFDHVVAVDHFANLQHLGVGEL